jgi:MYXO-CTERM domain-containing protein
VRLTNFVVTPAPNAGGASGRECPDATDSAPDVESADGTSADSGATGSTDATDSAPDVGSADGASGDSGATGSSDVTDSAPDVESADGASGDSGATGSTDASDPVPDAGTADAASGKDAAVVDARYGGDSGRPEAGGGRPNATQPGAKGDYGGCAVSVGSAKLPRGFEWSWAALVLVLARRVRRSRNVQRPLKGDRPRSQFVDRSRRLR